MHVAPDGREHHRSFRRRATLLFHKRFQKAHRSFHRFRRLQDERKLHLAAAEEIPDDFHPLQQNIVDNVER